MMRWVEQGLHGDPVVPDPRGREQWVSMLKQPICRHNDCRILAHRIIHHTWFMDIDRRQLGDLDNSCVLAVEA